MLNKFTEKNLRGQQKFDVKLELNALISNSIPKLPMPFLTVQLRVASIQHNRVELMKVASDQKLANTISKPSRPEQFCTP